MDEQLKTRFIRPPLKPFGTNLYVAAGVGITVGIGLLWWEPFRAPPASAIILLVSAIMLLLGYKIRQGRELSLTLTFMHLQFHSHYGGWLAKWHNIERIGQASVQTDGWYEPIPWVGVSLKNYDPFLTAICPRVATKLLLDQRILLVMAHKRLSDPPFELEDILFDDTPYITADGQTIKGLMAMLANRMRYNRELLGYDFFISEDFLDCSAAEFAGLARRYLAAS
ncbi:DUF2982 domain-containing protein [Photobacterium aquae]|uniref:DUF2982 domain-containing protein n=1 Tax=Photobacterium aquae TaxID=1195763 RepID=UPI0009FDF26A|nr:DUF2982 domain-containing protein [Photobacterium aquae]